MSFASVRPYFRTQLESLGFIEWTDSFAIDNIPSTILDGRFHMLFDNISPLQLGGDTQDLDISMTLRVFRKGFRNASYAIDQLAIDGDNIIANVLKPINRLGIIIKNVKLNSVNIEPYGPSDDNIGVLIMGFTVFSVICLT